MPIRNTLRHPRLNQMLAIWSVDDIANLESVLANNLFHLQDVFERNIKEIKACTGNNRNMLLKIASFNYNQLISIAILYTNLFHSFYFLTVNRDFLKNEINNDILTEVRNFDHEKYDLIKNQMK